MSGENFINYRIDERVAYGFTGGPDWSTSRTPMRNGIVRRNGNWDWPLHRYACDYALLADEVFEELRAMTYIARGGLYAFRFKDWDDYRAVHQPIGIGNGSSAPMQLAVQYTKGPVTFTRRIVLPLSPTVSDEDGAPVPVSVDPLTGLATPTGTWPTGKALFWDGEFDVPTYFERDFNPITRRSPNVSTQRLSLYEERAPLVAVPP